MNNNVKSITSISEPFYDGQRVTAAAVEYNEPVICTSVSKDAYEVAGRTVTKAYTAEKAEKGAPSENGRFVILELDPHDKNSRTYQEIPSDEPNVPGREGRLPDGRIYHGPHGIRVKRDEIKLHVSQVKEIGFVSGKKSPCFQMISDHEINLISDEFTVHTYKGITYNLFVPKNYDSTQKYPLVMFIHDAGFCGASPRLTLEQGIGATVWATEAEQKKHPCFIFAPQHTMEYPVANDDYYVTDEAFIYMEILDELQKQYSIDRRRIYTTGQSMGFMTSLALLIKYKGYFAGALLPAGHWNINETAGLYNTNVWMFVSERDKGAVKMLKLPEKMKELGGDPGYYEWDGSADLAALNALVKQAGSDGHKFRLTDFTGDSVLRKGQVDEINSGHIGTWYLVYRLEAVRDWLFSQSL